MEKPCDIPLKAYFCLTTVQLLLDVFRTDLIRVLCQWNPNSSSPNSSENHRIPIRIICYHVGYVIYALLVLRLGVKSIYFAPENSTCSQTAPELYHSSRVFVYLSIAVWFTILFGYVIPFCVVATLLTWNGYHPSADTIPSATRGTTTGVFPTAVSNGTSSQTIHQFRTIILQEFPSHYPRECCICLGDFSGGDVIVATPGCDHVFHKNCCQEWLKHAQTCPVCRKNLVPEHSDEENQNNNNLTQPFAVRPESHLEIVNLITNRLRSNVTPASPVRRNDGEVRT